MRPIFIGLASEFLNCSRIRLVDSYETLVKERIGEYTPDNESVRTIASAYRVPNSNPTQFLFDGSLLTSSFNNIIFDDVLENPIGFVYLEQVYDFSDYNLTTLEVLLDFDLVTQTTKIEFNINYDTHLSNTAEKKVHQKMITGNRANPVSLYDEVIYPYKGKRGFTKNIFHAAQDPKLVYKYSGKFYQSTSYFKNAEFNVLEDDLMVPNFIEIIRLDNILYLVLCQNSSNETIIYWTRDHDDSDEVNKYIVGIKIPNKHMIGANVIIARTSDDPHGDYYIYNTRDILQDILSPPSNPIQLGNYEAINRYTRTGGGYMASKFDNDSELHICKDPVKKDLMFYIHKEDTNQVIPLNTTLKRIFNNFGIDTLDTSHEVIYATQNTLLVKVTSPDRSFKYKIVSSTLPHNIGQNHDLVVEYDDLTNHDPSLFERMESLLTGVELDCITFLTQNLIYIFKSHESSGDNLVYLNDNNPITTVPSTDFSTDQAPDLGAWTNVFFSQGSTSVVSSSTGHFLVEISAEVNHSYDVQGLTHKVDYTNLIRSSGVENLHKIVKDTSSLNNTGILNLSIDGCLFGYNQDYITIPGESQSRSVFRIRKL